jgi:hypothetical protein
MILAEYFREAEQKKARMKDDGSSYKTTGEVYGIQSKQTKVRKRKRGAQTLRFSYGKCYKRHFFCQKNSALGKSLVT